MQTIARANRVWGEKSNGLIVDYVGVFRNLQRALAIYGSGAGGAATSGETPVLPKSALIANLKEQLAEATSYCVGQGISLEALLASKGFDFIKLRDVAVDLLLVTQETKSRSLPRGPRKPRREDPLTHSASGYLRGHECC